MTEDELEQITIEWFERLGYRFFRGEEIAPDGPNPQRMTYSDVFLEHRFRDAIARINPHLDRDALDEVARKILRLSSPSIFENNHAFHRYLTKGVGVMVKKNGGIRGEVAWLVDYANPENNDLVVVNQFTITHGNEKRRPDLVVFLNGIPIAVIELKKPGDPSATTKKAWNQFETYKERIPRLFDTNELLIISDGLDARVGSMTAGHERFGPWRTIDGTSLAPDRTPRLQVLIEGLFEPTRLLDYLRHFILWETGQGYIKKIAGYHQFHAVNKAVSATVDAAALEGDRRIGVIWHTQGSGKSVTMALFAAKVALQKELENPTILVLTDRNDLDNQLFGQFAAAKDLLETPEQADSREDLREKLRTRASGGVIFSTIQKFGTREGESMPELSSRRNIVVIADEAHRSHYEFVKGFARNLREALPRASFIGFTGTPIEFEDKSTPEVFGNYIDTYAIDQAIEDGATVPIYYEARLARIELPDEEKPWLDEEFDEVTELEEESDRERLKTTWARLESLVGTEKRLAMVAKDIVDHWERRKETQLGKAMIVCMSRRICCDLYAQIVKLRPEWHAPGDDQGMIKVVMTGSASDPPAMQPHIRNKLGQKTIEKRFKDPEDNLEMVIVRDMWLTGFDVPCANTLYLDKPMRGHSLMQAIARVNRVFKDKPSGLVVDYLGLADQLRKAVGRYGGDHGGTPALPVEQALAVLLEKFEVVKGMFHNFDYSLYFTGTKGDRLQYLHDGADYILGLTDGKKRFLDACIQLNKAAGLALHLEGARHMRDEIGYFQEVRGAIIKTGARVGDRRDRDEIESVLKQLVSKALVSDEVIDVFGAAGMDRPDISILSDEFLESVRLSPRKNLQIELLRKLLGDEIKAKFKTNMIQSKKFSEMLEKTLLAYQNRTLTSAEVIAELIKVAKELREEGDRGKDLNLSDSELAFYDALASYKDAREVMGDKVLAEIAQELVDTIRKSVSIDWTKKEAVRAKLRTSVKRLLKRKKYPPDGQEYAVKTIIEQAEMLCRDWC